MTDYNAEVNETYETVDGVIERQYADVIQVKTANGASTSFQVPKQIIRLRIGHAVSVITRKDSGAVAVILNRTTGKTLRIACSLTGTAMSKHVAGLGLYAVGAVVFFSGLLPAVWSTGVGLALFALGLLVIVKAPVRDDNAAAQAFDDYIAAQWKTGAAPSFTQGSAFR
jgi:hypothetical protein